MSFEYTAHGITAAGRAMLELFWDGTRTFIEFGEDFYGQHKAYVDRLAALRVRLPHALAPGETFRTRHHMVNLMDLFEAYPDTEAEEAIILAAADGAYIGRDFEESANDDLLPFRTWHITSHTRSKDDYRIDGLRGLTWFYAVDAQGQNMHSHAIVDLAHPRTKQWLIAAMGLSEDDKVSSVWSSIYAVRGYLDRQAVSVREVGQPTHEIFVSGRKPAIVAWSDRRMAWQQGEMAYYTGFRNNNAAFFEGIGIHPSVRFVESMQEATALAEQEARGGTNKVFTISYRDRIGPYNRMDPPRYRGEETIVIDGLPGNWRIEDQRWIRSARDVFVVPAGERVSAVATGV